MDCEVLSRYLDLYLDGELALEERAEVEAHVRTCDECKTAISLETRFRAALRQSFSTIRAPGSLHEGVARRLREHRAGSRTPAWGPSLAYAATLLVVAGAGYAFLTMTASPPDPASSVVAAHTASSGTEVYGDVERVSTFLKEHAPFQAHVPIGDREGLRLIGARVTQLASGTPAIVYLYDLGGRRMTVAQYPAPEGAAPSGVRLGRQDGLTVVTFPEGGLVQTLVGDVPEREVPKIIPASFGN